MATVKLHHAGKYTADTFTLNEVILSLSAQKELIEAGLKFLAQADPNFEYESAIIRVDYIKSGTLAWDLIVEVYGKYQTEIEDRVVEGLEGMFGVDIPPELEPIVTLATLAVTYIAARYAYERVLGSKGAGQPSVHIRGEGNTVIQQVAERIGATEDEVARALERSVPPKERRRLVPKVADFFRPARKEQDSMIELAGARDIRPEVIAEFPSDAEIAKLNDSKNVDVEGAEIDIRGTDRDKHKQGWHASITNDPRFEKRMPMDLYPTVNPDELANHRTIKRNVIVECEEKPDGGLTPKRIHLLSFEGMTPLR